MTFLGCPWRFAHLGVWANDSCAPPQRRQAVVGDIHTFGLDREAVAARTLSGASGPEAALPILFWGFRYAYIYAGPDVHDLSGRRAQ